MALAVGVGLLVAGCTAGGSGADDEVEVLAEVHSRDEAPDVDDLGDLGDLAEDRAAPDAPSDPVDRDTEGVDAPAAPPSDEAAAPEEAAPDEARGPPPSTPPTTGPSTSDDVDAPDASGGTAGRSTTPAPAPATPAPLVLEASDVASAGVLSSIDGDWVETSSVVLERGADPDPFVVDLRVTPGEADGQRVRCAVRLLAPADRGLVVRGEVLVAMVTEDADGVRRVPRLLVEVDVELAPGDTYDLPVSRATTVGHGPTDRSITCAASFSR